MLANSDTSTERCTNEIPQTSNPANCDAIACNAPASYMTEAGPMCGTCYRESGLPLVIDADQITHEVSPLWIRANTEATAELERRRPVQDFGTVMCGILDMMTRGGRL